MSGIISSLEMSVPYINAVSKWTNRRTNYHLVSTQYLVSKGSFLMNNALNHIARSTPLITPSLESFPPLFLYPALSLDHHLPLFSSSPSLIPLPPLF